MFKFNNNHIFTGYLKQLLASFHLPKCKIYTKELAVQEEKYLANKETWETALKTLLALQPQLAQDLEILKDQIEKSADAALIAQLEAIYTEYESEYNSLPGRINKLQNYRPKILPTTYHSEYYTYPNSIPDSLSLALKYPAPMRYIPYIKDGYLQVFADGVWHDCHLNFEDSNKHIALHQATKAPYAKIPYTYGQKILNYTKTLQIQNTVYDSYTHEYLGDYLRFHRDFANINLMPLYNCFSNRACPHLDISFDIGNNCNVKFKTDQSFETSLYKYYMIPVKFFKDYTIAIDSEASIEVCCCIYDEYHNSDEDFIKIPQLTYQCFGDLQFKKPVLYSKLQKLNDILLDPQYTANDLSQQEDSLKLILKVPINNKSSIVVLEGDYTHYNDSVAKPTTTGSFLSLHNKTTINYEDLTACDFLVDKLITPLQLLRANTGESYPFADRLIEYLVGNAITVNEEIQDNIVRAKTIISANCPADICSISPENGIWEPILQCLVYDYINKKQDVYDINHDILGFIDKDVENWYATKAKNTIKTIATVDIYAD